MSSVVEDVLKSYDHDVALPVENFREYFKKVIQEATALLNSENVGLRERIKKLEEERNAFHQQVNKLLKEIEAHKGQNGTLNGEINRLNGEIKKLRMMLHELEEKNRDSLRSVDPLHIRISELERLLEIEKKKASTIEKWQHKYETEIPEKDQQIKKLLDEIEHARSQMESWKSTHGTDLEKMSEELRFEKSCRLETEGEYKAALLEVEAMKDKVNTLSAQVRALENDNQGKLQKILEIEDILNHEKLAHRETSNSLKQIREELTVKVNDYYKVVENLKIRDTELSAQKQMTASLRQDLIVAKQKYDEELDVTRGKLRDNESMNQNDKKFFDEERKSWTLKITERDDEIAQLKERVHGLLIVEQERDDLKKTLMEVEGRAASITERWRKSESELARVNAMLKQREEVLSHAEKLKMENSQLVSENRRLDKVNKELYDDNTKKMQDLHKIEKLLNDARSNNEDLNKVLDEERKKVVAEVKRRTKAEADFNSFKREADSFKGRIDELTVTNSKLYDEVRNYETALAHAKADKDMESERLNYITTLYEKARQSLIDLEKECKDAKLQARGYSDLLKVEAELRQKYEELLEEKRKSDHLRERYASSARYWEEAAKKAQGEKDVKDQELQDALRISEAQKDQIAILEQQKQLNKDQFKREMEQIRGSHAQEVDALMKNIDDLQNQLNSTNLENQQIKVNFTITNESYNQVTKDNDLAQKELDRLRQEAARNWDAHSRELTKLRHEFDRINSRLADELKWRSEIENEQRNRETLAKRLNQLENELTRAIANEKSARDEAANLNKRFAAYRKEMEEKLASLKAIIHDYEEVKFKQMQNDLDHLKKQISAVTVERDHLSVTVDKLRASEKELRDQWTDLDHKIKDLKALHDADKTSLYNAKVELKDKTIKLDQLNHLFKDVEEENKQNRSLLEKEIAKSDKLLKELQEARAECKRLQSLLESATANYNETARKVKELEQQSRSLRSEFIKQSSKAEDLDKLFANLSEAQDKLEKVRSERDLYQSEVNHHKEYQEQLARHLEETRTHLSRSQAERDKYYATLQDRQLQVNEAGNHIESLKQLLHTSEADRVKLERTASLLEEENRKLNTELAKSVVPKSLESPSVQKSRIEIDSRNEEALKRLNLEIEKWKKDFYKACAERDSYKQEKEHLYSSLQNTKVDLANYKLKSDELTPVKKQLEEKIKEEVTREKTEVLSRSSSMTELPELGAVDVGKWHQDLAKLHREVLEERVRRHRAELALEQWKTPRRRRVRVRGARTHRSDGEQSDEHSSEESEESSGLKKRKFQQYSSSESIASLSPSTPGSSAPPTPKRRRVTGESTRLQFDQ